MELPPKDSWIRLGAGEAVTLTADVQKEWKTKTSGLRELRGWVLAAVFEVEYSLDRLLLEVFFPGHDKPSSDQSNTNPSQLGIDFKQRSALFDDLLLKSRPLSLDRKIGILKEAANKVQSLSVMLPKDFIPCLQKLSQIRSKFAHYPVSFVPVNESGKQVLQGRLNWKNEEIILDEAYLLALGNQLSEAQAGIEQVIRSLTS